MTDFSREAQEIVDAVKHAMHDVSAAALAQRAAATGAIPTPFQRAVIGGLVLIVQAAQQSAFVAAEQAKIGIGPMSWIDPPDASAAMRAIAPFLDETQRPA